MSLVKILNGQTSLCCDLMQAVSTLAPTRIEAPEPGLVQNPRGNPFRQIWIIGKNGLPYVHHNFTQVKTSDEMLVSGLFSVRSLEVPRIVSGDLLNNATPCYPLLRVASVALTFLLILQEDYHTI